MQLFHASVRDNLTLFDLSIPDDAVTAVLHEVGLTLWLDALTQGLDTSLAGSHALSAGEAQLLAFARVLLKDPHIVILDEATSRLDPVTEVADRTCSGTVAGGAHRHRHRPSTRTRSLAPTRFYCLEQGRVIEFGDYALLAQNADSHFATLLRSGAFAEELTRQAIQETIVGITQ